MENEKRCERCGETIATMWETDWHRFIRLKYCPECRRRVKLDQNNEYRRQKKKAVRDARKLLNKVLEQELAENERLRALKLENDQLRRMIGAQSRRE